MANYTMVNSIINGEWVPAASGKTYEVVNPAKLDEVVGHAALAGEADVNQAIEAAQAAYPAWSALSFHERASCLERISQVIVEDEADMKRRVALLTREHGKVLFESGLELSRLGGRFSLYATYADRLAQDENITGGLFDSIVTRQPRGVAALIVPWNWPLSILGAKLPAALLSGNTVVVKLAEQVPLASLQTLKLMADVLPPGVLNIIASPPSEIGDALITHPLVRKISFTGSIKVGKYIMQRAAETLKQVTLELGGNDPAILLDDVVLDQGALRNLIIGTFLTSGQICMAIKRIYVPRSRYDEFMDKFMMAAGNIVLGNGLEEGVTMGPVNNKMQYDKIKGIISDAEARGATVTEVGQVHDSVDFDNGYFIRPRVVTSAPDDARIVAEEQFGPVIPILPYDSEEEAIGRANGTEYGLCSSVWTPDKKRAVAVAKKLEAGYTYLNAHGAPAQDSRVPFGGFKQSGIGRILGFDGLLEYLEPHSISGPAGWLHGG